eukprot:CAMPEP_0176087170 /NCGR_PEP_ID=MMETSP0120_2-20121206/43638_1 /TAXON_ID=160619 /ORGANISM="Kryptoperidinium foliaceum, Strain CCMP 1326" /LENGTH=887 /DNA_ID=CAMNT_0017421009 /DNA_START=96 /DNA_END=2759 /DNA_ORIENTATION=+
MAAALDAAPAPLPEPPPPRQRAAAEEDAACAGASTWPGSMAPNCIFEALLLCIIGGILTFRNHRRRPQRASDVAGMRGRAAAALRRLPEDAVVGGRRESGRGRHDVVDLRKELEKLGQSDAPAPEAFEVAVDRIARLGSMQLAEEVEELARTRHVDLSAAALEKLICIYARGWEARGLDCLQRMVSAGHVVSEACCRNAMRRCADSQCPKLADALFAALQRTSRLRPTDLKKLMKTYYRAGEHDKVCDLYAQIVEVGLDRDPVAYAYLLRSAQNAGRIELHQELLERSEGLGCLKAMMLSARSASQAGDLSKALAITRRLQEEHPERMDTLAYNMAIDMCCRSKDMSTATEFFDKMEAMHVEKSIVTYNTMIKGYCTLANVEAAKRLLNAMTDAGQRPDATTFSSMMSGAARTRDFEQVWDVLALMDYHGVPANSFVVSILMQACRRADDSRIAAQALAYLDRPDVDVCEDVIVFNNTIDCCIYWKDLRRLGMALRRFDNRAIDWKPQVRTYGLLIKAHATFADIQRAREAWNAMLRDDLTPNVVALSCMIDALVESRQVSEAAQLFQEWSDKVPVDTVLYATLIKGFGLVGNAKVCLLLYEDMKARGVPINQITYTSLVAACATSGATCEAAELMADMRAAGFQPNAVTYSAIIRGHCMQGDLEKAFEVYHSIRQDGVCLDCVVYNILLAGCLQRRHWQLADVVIDHIQQQCIVKSSVTNATLVKMWSRRGDLQKAIDVVYEGLTAQRDLCPGGARHFRPYIDAHVGSCIIGACMHHEAPARALEIFQDMRRWPHFEGPDIQTYNAMVSGLAKHGFLQQAVDCAEELCERPPPLAMGKLLDRGVVRQVFRAMDTAAVGGMGTMSLRKQMLKTLRTMGMPMERWWAG